MNALLHNTVLSMNGSCSRLSVYWRCLCRIKSLNNIVSVSEIEPKYNRTDGKLALRTRSASQFQALFVRNSSQSTYQSLFTCLYVRGCLFEQSGLKPFVAPEGAAWSRAKLPRVKAVWRLQVWKLRKLRGCGGGETSAASSSLLQAGSLKLHWPFKH